MRSVFLAVSFVLISWPHLYGYHVEVSSKPFHVSYWVKDNGCQLTWDRYLRSGKSEYEYIVQRTSCSKAMGEQVPMIRALALRVFGDANVEEVVMGRLIQNKELSERFAKAAAVSPRWDSKLGRPNLGDLNTVALAIAIEADIVRELNDALLDLKKTAKILSVEKVLVESAGKLPYFKGLAKIGIKEDEKLPFDFLWNLGVEGTSLKD